MPSLADALSQLSAQSEQIVYHSSQNTRPSGPFVKAYLDTPSVLHLIRDADPAEARLFKFVGEESSGAKRVEKRDDAVVTPLKDLKKKGGEVGRDQVGIMIKTAMRLVDDYRPMPRARAHIQNLLDAHQRQAERVAELERLIQEATNPAPVQPRAKAGPSKPQLSPDEAIKAEELALRKLEAKIAPHRKTPKPSVTPSPARSPSPEPARRTAHTPARTPAKTPTAMPHIANSLVNGTTPRRPVQQTLNRFSPLKLLTPRAPVGRSSLRPNDIDGDAQRSIFGRTSILRSSTSSARKASPVEEDPEDEDEEEEADAPLEDETVRLGPVVDVDSADQEGDETAVLDSSTAADVSVDHDDEAKEEEAAEEQPVETGPRRVEGVAIESELVQQGTDKVWATLPDMMRQGVREGVFVGSDAESTVKHLYALSQSDPDPPPSPSNASSLSSATSTGAVAKAPPVVAQTILLAHLLLLLLRSSDASISVQGVKEALATMIRARGWDDGEDLATKIIYLGVGKRVVKIDRRGGGGGKVVFAI